MWALEQDTETCLLWPFGTKGKYGGFSLSGQSTYTHRYVCEARHGAPPTPKHEVAHRCGKRKCCNWRHLRWATRKENHADKKLHGTENQGTRNGNHKLTSEDVRAIRGSAGSSWDEAAKYGLNHRTVRYIREGKRWGWLE